MKFSTPVELNTSANPIAYAEPLMMLGSCFTDNIGKKLADDGFNVDINPMGVLFNPASIARVVKRAFEQRPYKLDDLYKHDDIWHCLDFASKRQDVNPDALLDSLNRDFANFARALDNAQTWIITFGTAWLFDHLPTSSLVGNCHKLPAAQFERRRLSVDEIVKSWQPLCKGRRVIFTVSPIRHLADGLHGNSLSKATLLLAVESLCKNGGMEYFPSFEIINDELRDYRFYNADMKHPSQVAIDYIYECFGNVYFTKETKAKALETRRVTLRLNHSTIL